MPIFVKDYRWKQNESEIRIFIPISNVRLPKVDCFTNENYIKINFSPYLFELHVHDSIIPHKTKCTIKQNEVIIELTKSVPTLWQQLEREIDKEELLDTKKRIFDRERERIIERANQNEKEKEERKRNYHDFQMTRSEEQKTFIQGVKDRRKAEVIRDVATWKDTMKINSAVSSANTKNINKREQTPNENEMKLALPIPVPFPRKNGTIMFSFSPRILPTPKRESRSAEEEEWLKKETEIREATGFIPEDANEEEKDPSRLLTLGINFFNNRNYLGALNVFQYGCQIAPKMPEFYLQLAKTHVKLNRLPKAIDNATIALELLIPAVEKNRELRIEAYEIRAQAYELMGEIKRSLEDRVLVQNLR